MQLNNSTDIHRDLEAGIHIEPLTASNLVPIDPQHQMAALAKGLLAQPIRNIMIPRMELPIVHPTTTLGQTIGIMEKKDYGYAFLLENDAPKGIITERDLLKHVAKTLISAAYVAPDEASKIFFGPVSNYASPGVITVHQDWRAVYAMRTFDQYEFRRLGVVATDQAKNETFVGAISERTIVRYLHRLCADLEEEHFTGVACLDSHGSLASLSPWTSVTEVEQVAGSVAEELSLTDADLACLLRALLGCKVHEFMKPLHEVPIFIPQDPLQEVIHGMINRNYGYAFIVDNKERPQVLGVFTERDFLRQVTRAIAGCLPKHPEQLQHVFGNPIWHYMTVQPTYVTPQHSLLSAIRFMYDKSCRRLPVCREGSTPGSLEIIGAVSERTIVRHIMRVMCVEYNFGADHPQNWAWQGGR